jgi:hypothetical protein
MAKHPHHAPTELTAALLASKRAIDVFYVKDAYGIKIIHTTKLAHVERALLAACGEGANA